MAVHFVRCSLGTSSILRHLCLCNECLIPGIPVCSFYDQSSSTNSNVQFKHSNATINTIVNVQYLPTCRLRVLDYVVHLYRCRLARCHNMRPRLVMSRTSNEPESRLLINLSPGFIAPLHTTPSLSDGSSCRIQRVRLLRQHT